MGMMELIRSGDARGFGGSHSGETGFQRGREIGVQVRRVGCGFFRFRKFVAVAFGLDSVHVAE